MAKVKRPIMWNTLSVVLLFLLLFVSLSTSEVQDSRDVAVDDKMNVDAVLDARGKDSVQAAFESEPDKDAGGGPAEDKEATEEEEKEETKDDTRGWQEAESEDKTQPQDDDAADTEEDEAAEAEKETEEDAMDARLPEEIDDFGEDEDEDDEDEEKDEGQKKVKYLKSVEIDRSVVRNKTHDGIHPFLKPNIVDDIYYTYRRFRKMKLIRHGSFWMGTNDPKSETGEYPLRNIKVRSFYLDVYPVINAFYWAYRAKKRFVRSEAEVKGWSWVTENVVSRESRWKYSTAGPKGWLAVKKARWDKPEGPDSNLEDRWSHPVVHLSWHDAKQFCKFHGARLPSEQEWEYAARAGLVAEEYPWGDRWERRRANTWQGKWPAQNTEGDGYRATSSVDAYRPQNSNGLYDMMGNVWEWTHSRYFERLISRDLQGQMHVLKGGSFVDTVDGDINLAVRNGQRTGQAPDYTASNVGFRCARSAPEMDPKEQPVKKKIKPRDVQKKKLRVPKIYRNPKSKPKEEL